MPTSDDELNAQRALIAKLRKERNEAEAERARTAKEFANDADMALLLVEEAKLQAEIADLKKQKGDEVAAGEIAATRLLESAALSSATSVDPETGVLVAPGEGPGMKEMFDAQENARLAEESEASLTFDSNSSPVTPSQVDFSAGAGDDDDDNEGR